MDKKGIYRIRHIDEVKDKEGNPKTVTSFTYYYSTGKDVSKEDQDRINKLGIAPAYENVWVSEDKESKIQATGIDAKGRKQYRYLTSFILKKQKMKFLRLFMFIKALPRLNKQLNIHKNEPNFSKFKVMSVIFEVIKKLHMRVGKDCYAKMNKSFGVTSLKKSHVKIVGDSITFNFKAKSNKRVSYILKDKFILNQIIALMELEGERLFQYVNDKDGKIYKITYMHLNKYLQKFMGKDFSCKDFRTYASNRYFVKYLLDITKKRNPKNKTVINKNIREARDKTAKKLRHTKSIAKKSYILNFIMDKYVEDPDYFVKNRDRNPIKLLVELLESYKAGLSGFKEDI
jgi:DNA topoisomerase-1